MSRIRPAIWEPAASALGEANCVLKARSRRHAVQEFSGPLSIKVVQRGRVAWRLGRRELWVDPSSYLVLNDREPYSMEIDEPEPVETLVVFFERGFVEGVFHALAGPAVRSLDEVGSQSLELLFLSRLRPRSSSKLAAAISEISVRVNPEAPRPPVMALDECYLHLAAELVRESEETRKLIHALPAARFSTRAELLRRVARGRDYIHAVPDRSTTLAEVARAAAMSAFHFQRTFTRVFGVSPARYAADLRLRNAAEHLSAGATVTDVALECGYGSLAAFSAAFQRSYGQAPSRFAADFARTRKRGPEDFIRKET